MRLFVILCLLFSMSSRLLYGQPCQQEQPQNKQRSDLLEGFLWQSQQAKLITQDKGIALLRQETDSLGREVWTLTPHLDDSYREEKSLPRSYYQINGVVILIWKEADLDQPLDSLQKQQLLTCLKEVVGSRITPKPPVEENWEWARVAETDEQGRPKLDANRQVIKQKVKVKQTISSGGPTRSQFVFGKDGSVRKYLISSI